jgi:hypothetical protein
MSATIEKTCPSCGKTFKCRQEAGCWCGEVRLAQTTIEALRARFVGCLCEGCLRKEALREKPQPGISADR